MYILCLCTSFVFPILIAYYYWKKQVLFHSFFLGGVCFFFTQYILRPVFFYAVKTIYVPIQIFLEKSYFENIMVVVVTALSAGLFEEIGRYIVWRKMRNFKPSYRDAIAFGFGHGGLESIGGLGLLVLMDMRESIYLPLNLSSLMLLINRPIAMVMHCTLTLVVFYKMFEKKQKWMFVVLAIMLHFFLDFIGGILMWGYDHSVFWANSWTAFFIAMFNLFMALTVGTIFVKLYIQNEKANYN